MKFSLILLLVASVAAIQKSDPAGAYKNFKDGLVVSDKVVAKQHADEAKHTKAAKASLDRGHKEATALKQKVW